MAGRHDQLDYRLHESTQRGLCRLAFVLCGLLPVLGCLICCAAEFLPAYQRWRAQRWEQQLSAQLGLSIEIAAVESLSPEKVRLRGLRLVHPETQASLGRAATAEIESYRGQWCVRLQQLEVEGRQMADLWTLLHDWYLCRPVLHSQSTHLEIDALTIHDADRDTQLSELSLRLLPEEALLQLAISFRHQQLGNPSKSAANSPADSPDAITQLLIKRNHQANHLMTEMVLNTGQALPCRLMAGIDPRFARLGDAATFNGRANLILERDTWRLKLTRAHVEQLDFGTLTHGTQAAVTAMGGVHCEEAIIRNGRVEYAMGRVSMGPGRLSSPLLQSLGHYLDVTLRQSPSVAIHAFDAVDFSIGIHRAGLRLAGLLPGDSLMDDGLGSLASRPAQDWALDIPLERIVLALDSLPAPEGSLSPSRSQSALTWLPLDDAPARAASNLRSVPH